MKPLQFGPIGSIFASAFSFIAKKVLRDTGLQLAKPSSHHHGS